MTDEPKPRPSASTDRGDDLDELDELGSSAADDPTAVWDESALAAAGVVASAASRGPATRPDVGGHDQANVVLAPPRAVNPAAPAPPPAAPRAQGLSWPLTVALAVGVGVAVFVVIRALS